MRDRLPSIHISVTDAPRFLDEFTRIAETFNSLAVTRRASGNYPVSLRCNDDSPLNNCSAHFMIETGKRIYVAITISSEDFSTKIIAQQRGLSSNRLSWRTIAMGIRGIG
jgi:hypothetical protein